MVFSSIIFIFYFMPVFLLGCYVSGWRTGALLTGSVVFYVWGEGAYILLLGGLIVLNYFGSLMLANLQARRRLALLAALVTGDLSVLGFFKYGAFLADNLNGLLSEPLLPQVHLALPLGISFFTFQLISYVVDVHRGAIPAERDPLKFATYILMFPHLIAGPIVRYADIRDEMHADRRHTVRAGLGVQYFIVGLSQKVLVANAVAPLADYAFGQPTPALDGLTAWLGVWAYTLQIYFDFCGYSNMAIGLAFLLGFTFPKNFNYPYAAVSMTDFWRRWHISLSSWFRDYVYIPLGGNRGGQGRTVRNLLIVFFLTGLWHGAAWRFVVWGLMHGAFLMIERFGFGAVLGRSPKLLRRIYVLAVVMSAWVFFRADSLPHALDYLRALAPLAGFAAPPPPLLEVVNAEVVAALVLGSIFAFPVLPALLERLRVARASAPDPDPHRAAVSGVHALPTPLLAAAFMLSIALLAGSSLNPFLYFRF